MLDVGRRALNVALLNDRKNAKPGTAACKR
jgi:hypothetical protein